MNISRRALEGLGIGTLVAAGFFVAASVVSPTVPFWYLGWNLALAYIPLTLTYPLLAALRRRGWLNWRTLGWGLLWLVWLPNSFYVLTDVVHLSQHSYGLDPLFGVALFSLFAGLGLAAGFLSLMTVHRAARQLGGARTYAAAEVILALCSGATYAGRTLRWNSWDLVVHPAGVAEALLMSTVRPNAAEIVTIVTFFGLLSGVYAALWRVFGVWK